MAVTIKKLCACGRIQPCAVHYRQYDRERGNSGERGYDAEWQRYRLQFLEHYPLCALCLKNGAYVRATVVDHIQPHRGNLAVFWDESNHQSLCASCHGAKSQSERISR